MFWPGETSFPRHQSDLGRSSTVVDRDSVSAGIGHLSLKRKGPLSVAENGGSLRRSCEFGSDMLWPPPLESDGRSRLGASVSGFQSRRSMEMLEQKGITPRKTDLNLNILIIKYVI